MAEALLTASLGSRSGGGLIEVDDAPGRAPARRACAGERVRDPRGARGAAHGRGRADRAARGVPRPAAPAELGRARVARSARRPDRRRRPERAPARAGDRSAGTWRRRSRRNASRRNGSTRSTRSRARSHSLSLQTTIDVLATSIVTLLGVDAAVVRLPDERGLELEARAVEVDDARVDEAARALLSRPQPLLRRDLLQLLGRSEPLLLDAARAEELGGALALLAPFLRKGSSAALIPIATPAELLATLTIVSLHPDRPIDSETAGTALAIAGQAALAIDNARLYGQQRPSPTRCSARCRPAPPRGGGLELGDVYESCARGGGRRRLRLPDARRRAPRRRPRRRHRPRRRCRRRHGDGEVRVPLAREHVVPGEFLAAANDVVSSDIGPGRFIHHGRARARHGEGRGRARAAAIRRRGSSCPTAGSRRSRRAASRWASSRRSGARR